MTKFKCIIFVCNNTVTSSIKSAKVITTKLKQFFHHIIFPVCNTYNITAFMNPLTCETFKEKHFDQNGSSKVSSKTFLSTLSDNLLSASDPSG